MPFDKIYPPLAGSACSICYGAGKQFGLKPTPSYLVLKLFGIRKGILWTPGDGEPPNGFLKLTQESPCQWRYNDGFLDIYWRFANTYTFCNGVQNSKALFSGTIYTTCLLQLNNDVVTPNSYFYLGNASLVSYT
jgi:hypothetical protein